MSLANSNLFGTLAVGAGIGLGADYVLHGPDSIIGKFLEAAGMGAPKAHIPSGDPLYGRPKFGEPAGSRFVVPVKTMRTPFPLGEPDASGRIEVPFHSSPIPHDKKNKKHGVSHSSMDSAARSIAEMVYNDTAVQLPPTKFAVGNTDQIHKDILFVYTHDPPEIFLKLARLHEHHGANCLNPASPVYQQERKLAGSAADFYEHFMGIEKMYSREGFAMVGEYDDEDDRQAAEGAESPIQFNVGGAYYNM
jgi:hypothetical protein